MAAPAHNLCSVRMGKKEETEVDRENFDERMEQWNEIMDAIRHHIAHTRWDGRKHWGPWSLVESKEPHLLFAWVNPHGVLIPDQCEIPLRPVQTAYGLGNDSIEDWCWHLRKHTAWMTHGEVLQLVEALCSLYNAGICGEQVKA